MKITCSVCIANHSVTHASAISSRPRFGKAALALCKNPKSEEYFVILFNGTYKSGIKYQVKGNMQVLTKFINEGKATLHLKTPPQDVFLKGDVIQLKGFVHLLRRVLDGSISPKELTYSGMSVTHTSNKNVAPTKMIVKGRSEFPSKGFPRTLEKLCINNIKRFDIGNSILRLRHLRELDLSNNELNFIPKELNKLFLRELNLSSNFLGNSSPRQWAWIGGNLSNSLLLLNLDSNNLKYLPNEIVTLKKLVTLNINNNKLEVLPAGLGRLRQLRVLNAANNSLSKLPASIKKCHLQHLNLFNNTLDSNECTLSACSNHTVRSLKESAARTVLNLGFSYSSDTIPQSLVNYLDYAKFCICGKACFDVFTHASFDVPISSIAHEYVVGFNQTTVNLDCFFCSVKCFRSCKPIRRNLLAVRDEN